jgi:RimJ/RimL family protein N-acetyltransferase
MTTSAKSPVTLRTQRLVLRPWRDTDREPFAAMNADPRVMEFYPRTHDRRESDEIAARIIARIEAEGYGLWAVELPDEAPFIGFIGLQMVPFEHHFTPALEVGWRLAAEFWGRGFATEGARAALEFAHGELGREEVVAMTAVVNRRSRRVMEKLGMTCDPDDDFEVPRIPAGHPLRPHVLYRHRAAAAS